MTPAQTEWARCRDWIKAAVDQSPGLETIEDVERKIGTGQYQFWPGLRSAAVTEVQTYDAKLILMVLHGGGELRELMDEMEPAFCKYALARGCDAIAGVGREGWKRVAKKHGYRFAMIIMMKDLR